MGGEGGEAAEYETITCEGAPTASPGADVCSVTPGDQRVLIVGDVLTPDAVYEQGAVLVEQGTIRCVGCDCLDEAAGATQVVCPDAVVSPGLINAHDHVGWMNGRPWVATENGVDPELRWEHRNDWRRGNRGNPEVSVDGGGSNTDEKLYGEVRFLLSGATAIFGSGDLAGLMRDLDNTGDGDNGLGDPGAKYDTFPLGDTSGTQQENGCGNYDVTDVAADYYDCHAPHVAEGIDRVAQNEFACLTGVGASSKDVLDSRTAIIHGIGLTPGEMSTMAGRGMRLIWSPRSNISLYGDTAQVTVMDRLGVSIGLGTDWLPSGSMNMLRELACAASFNDNNLGGYFSDRRLWQMATLGSARALAFDDATGVLAQGYAADIAVFANDGNSHYSSVVRADVEDVALVMRGGDVMNGNAPVVSALEQGCEALDVCGVPKQVCVQRDTGSTLASVEASIDPAYPLFFCGAPDDEPSCLPARTLAADSVEDSGLYAGMSSSDDADGDGIVDASDNCSTMFNPVRPVDDGVQADFDGDGVGDVCDVCPLDAGVEDCAGADPDDSDGDGILNTEDNCPGQPNADQADADDDQKGDVCDACPNTANPGALECPGETVSIFEIQDESDPNHPAEGTRVRIECVISAVGVNAAWCQDPVGGPHSGIMIYVGDAPTYGGQDTVLLGDSVQVDGDYTEFFGLTQLENAVFTYLDAGTVPNPVVLDPADIATGGALAEDYEGVLVQVLNVTVTNVNPDDPDDYDELEVDGLRIDDLCIDGGGDGGLLDNDDYTGGESFTSVTGVLHYSFSNFKLLPRSTSDLVP
jgi:cytosine/adenosine deaminase-related metal-dependent hydrolase